MYPYETSPPAVSLVLYVVCYLTVIRCPLLKVNNYTQQGSSGPLAEQSWTEQQTHEVSLLIIQDYATQNIHLLLIESMWASCKYF